MEAQQESYYHLSHKHQHRESMKPDEDGNWKNDVGGSTTGGIQEGSRSRQNDSRAPLRSITPPPQSSSKSITAAATTGIAPTICSGRTTASSNSNQHQQEWLASSSKADTTFKNNRGTCTSTTESISVVQSSFELEDSVSGSAGNSSWTLRVPWLRSKRHRRIRQDDESSSIQTNQSRARTASITDIRGDETNNSVYYGGLMKTGDPINHQQHQPAQTPGTLTEMCNNHAQLQEQAPQYVNQQLSQSSSSYGSNKKVSKQKRKQYFRKKNKKDAVPNLDHNVLPQYNMHGSSPASAVAANPTSNNLRHYSLAEDSATKLPYLKPKNNNKVFRNRSWISTSSRESAGDGSRRGKRRRDWRNHHQRDDDSLADFDDTEWTPQDSSYGAAIPVCGWVPKRLRQGIEATLIALIVLALVYLVVTTSISIQENKTGGKHTVYNDSIVYSDDDWYVEFSQYQNDQDDYYYDMNVNGNNNNYYAGENGDGRDNDEDDYDGG